MAVKAKGVYQYTAGNAYKISLSGSASATGATKSDFTVALKNTIDLGASTGLKWSYDLTAARGTSYKFKGTEISFSTSKIGVSEYSGSHCLDMFQASAGIATVARAEFDAQRKAAKVAMWSIVAADVIAQIASALSASFGHGFDNPTDETYKDTKRGAEAALEPLLSAVAPLAAMFALCKFYLEDVAKKTKATKHWNPNAFLQATASHGILIGAAPQLEPGRSPQASFMKQDESGTTLTVFKTRDSRGPTLWTGQRPIPGGNEYTEIGGFNLQEVSMSKLAMTNRSFIVQSDQLTFDGKTGVGSRERTGTKLSALFENVDLTAQQAPGDKTPPNASLVLSGGETPEATLSAGAGNALSSVTTNGTAVELRSGTNSSLSLKEINATIKSKYILLVADAVFKLRSQRSVNIIGKQSVLIKANGLIKLN